jgi:hypothetical protein
MVFYYKAKENGVEGAVLTGGGTFTQRAFANNFGNFYLVKLPHVFDKFRTQFDRVFTSLAKSEQELPVTWDYITEPEGASSNVIK